MNVKRVFDLVIALAALGLFAVPILLIALLVKLTSPGPIFYWSDRVGQNNRLFRMPKFRTMQTGTPTVATHLLDDPDRHVTPLGTCLRKSSLDELPQLWSVLKGDMSFVGPRPALYNQQDLIELRTKCSVHKLIPGITGWAQVNGRDELPIAVKVEYDAYYLRNHTFLLDLKILWRTLVKVLAREGVSY